MKKWIKLLNGALCNLDNVEYIKAEGDANVAFYSSRSHAIEHYKTPEERDARMSEVAGMLNAEEWQ